MDVNKAKCKTLKAVRARLAKVLGVELHQRECTFEGKCSGTCPKCKQEEAILNKALLKKGAIAVATTGVAMGLTGCSTQDFLETFKNENQREEVLAGLVESIEPDSETDKPETESPDVIELTGEVAPPQESEEYGENHLAGGTPIPSNLIPSTSTSPNDELELLGDVAFDDLTSEEFEAESDRTPGHEIARIAGK